MSMQRTCQQHGMTAMTFLVQGASMACIDSSTQCMKLSYMLSAERPPGRCKLVCIGVADLGVFIIFKVTEIQGTFGGQFNVP